MRIQVYETNAHLWMAFIPLFFFLALLWVGYVPSGESRFYATCCFDGLSMFYAALAFVGRSRPYYVAEMDHSADPHWRLEA